MGTKESASMLAPSSMVLLYTDGPISPSESAFIKKPARAHRGKAYDYKKGV